MLSSSVNPNRKSEERHTESVTSQKQNRSSRFKIRRASFSHTVYKANNRIGLQSSMSTKNSEMAVYPALNRIPTSLQTSPVIPDKRFANVSRLPRVKNDSSGSKAKTSRNESTILSR